MKSQLLCTFTKRNKLYDTIDLIIACHEILYNKIYVFTNENDHHELICTYNITGDYDFAGSDTRDTISLHRKKQSNSLYTINALNELVKKLNNGVLDNSFPIPWENYRNRMLLTNEEGLYEIPTRVYSIIHTKTWKSDIDEK